MKTTTLILLLIFFTNIVSSQITKTKIAEKQELKEILYDSLKNYLGKDVYKYLNQELYLNEKKKSDREIGYYDFVLDYRYKGYDFKSNTYKCCSGFKYSKYEDLKGRYFKVINIHKHPRAEERELAFGNNYYLELEERDSKDKVYYSYNASNGVGFPFIVVGFFEKNKKLLVGKEFVFANRALKTSTGNGLDIMTGKPIIIKTGEKWKCKDFTVEEKNYTLALIIENLIGEITTVSYDTTFDEKNSAYTSKQADEYKNKFGTEKFNLILQGEVKIGMTKEMCKLSWGEPKDINSTISSGKKSEQWVYDENYLYFDNGFLTTIQ